MRRFPFRASQWFSLAAPPAKTYPYSRETGACEARIRRFGAFDGARIGFAATRLGRRAQSPVRTALFYPLRVWFTSLKVIRLWIDQQAETTVGWIGALHDQPISKALGLIHQSLARKWTVKELAQEVALSRSAFSARFTQLVGEPPLTYLTRWRMLRATRLLKNDVRIETIAESLGYRSEAAFRKAFKREIGIPPAQYRRLG